MNRLLIGLYVLLLGWVLFASYGHCANVTFAWDPNDPAEGVMEYKLHLGNGPRTYSRVVPAGNVTEFTVPDVPDGKWYAAATAHDVAGNSSDFSNEVEFIIDTLAPSGVRQFRFKSVGRE